MIMLLFFTHCTLLSNHLSTLIFLYHVFVMIPWITSYAVKTSSKQYPNRNKLIATSFHYVKLYFSFVWTFFHFNLLCILDKHLSKRCFIWYRKRCFEQIIRKVFNTCVRKSKTWKNVNNEKNTFLFIYFMVSSFASESQGI